jgi:hypothetical protein
MSLNYSVISITRDSILKDIKAVGFEEYVEALYFVLGNEFDEFMAQDIADEILAEAFRKAIATYKNHLPG